MSDAEEVENPPVTTGGSRLRDVYTRVVKAGNFGCCPAWAYKVMGVILCLQVGYFAYALYRNHQDIEGDFGEPSLDRLPPAAGFTFEPKTLERITTEASTSRFGKRAAPPLPPTGGEKKTEEVEEVGDLSFTLDHLLRYGYLTRAEAKRGSTASGRKDLRAALRKYQKFMSLPETGKMDEATDEMMAKPRCGNKDLGPWPAGRPEPAHKRNQGAIATGKRWPDKLITYQVLVYPTSERIPRQKVDLEMARAFKAWSQVTPLEFERAATGGGDSADIEISFMRDSHRACPMGSFAKTDETLAHAFAPGPEALSGAIHFNDYHLWAEDSSEGQTLYSVALHGIGHALGLVHTSHPEAIMYATERDRGLLHDDDIKAIRSLYGGRRVEETGGRKSTTTPSDTDEISTTTTSKATNDEEEEEPMDQPRSTTAAPAIKVPICGTDGRWLFAGPTCRQFYDCRGGSAKLRLCPGDLVWNKSKNLCDQKRNVADCRRFYF